MDNDRVPAYNDMRKSAKSAAWLSNNSVRTDTDIKATVNMYTGQQLVN